jgi:hypothetical protein
MMKLGGSLIEEGLGEMMWMMALMKEGSPTRRRNSWIREKMMRQKRLTQGEGKGRKGRDKKIISMTRKTLILMMTHLMRMVVQAREPKRRDSRGRGSEGGGRRLNLALILMISMMIMMMRMTTSTGSNQVGNQSRRKRRRRRRSRKYSRMAL